MILHKLSLNNVGLFRDLQTVYLTPNDNKPLILIGGMNGTGKTTLLDGVRLCLYGRRSLGTRVTLNEYHEYLSKLIHRPSNTKLSPNHAYISLEFEFTRGSEKKLLCVNRSWKRTGTVNNIKEKLSIYEDNRLNNELDVEHWQEYLNELIPIGASQFFFFDGEDIQKLANDSHHDSSLAESIKVMLGLNFVERLQSDLCIYANRLAKQNSPEPLKKEIEKVELEIRTLESSIKSATQKLESIQTEIENIEVQISQQEAQITTEGGNFVEKRESLKLQQEQLSSNIEEIETKIRDKCAGLFPFALVPDLLRKLRNRLLKEIELDEWEAQNRALNTQNTKLLKLLVSEDFWNDGLLSDSQIENVQSKITPLIKTQLDLPKKLHEFVKIRDRSTSDYKQLLNWVDTCLSDIPKEFHELNDTLTNTHLELQKVEQFLQRIPDEDVLKPMIECLSKLNHTLGELHKQEEDAEKINRTLLYKLAEAERILEKLYQSQKLGEAHIQRQKRVEEVQTVLSTYTVKITQTKIATLGNTVIDGFNQLSHKPNRITRVEIDPETFCVTLYDTSNKRLYKEELSAGEKQIYTTALLWGLAKTSGKSLPMILDTPLGRLDSKHRQLLVERYFPFASHQVILLTTDTELEKNFLSSLQPYVSHTLNLIYQQTEGCTTIEEGYFGEAICD